MDALNFHVVVVFLLGVTEYHASLIPKHVDTLLPLDDPRQVRPRVVELCSRAPHFSFALFAQAITAIQRITHVADVMAVRALHCTLVVVQYVFVQETGLEPDAVVMTSILWDLLQRYVSYVSSFQSGGNQAPRAMFTSRWVTDRWAPAFNETVIQVACSGCCPLFMQLSP